ncbi:aspartate/glutamate racemase family protein [Frigoriflavimonas asaccharolytica]|uniref:Aspartate racemase n=1 Tax=Frigoriflavimonas asaccharolytica TaxID=2735899 RepID=A0A8J8K8M2_9FLAO|nr:aspartate/glutamate racemase family protein [Frigoriflavimonas asaccharolytica]NRS93078.1 aspartate racemase [Frigoriflavimonas asaccharolytica]
MKKGILGLGNASTIFYIDEINSQYNKMNGGFSTCPFLLYQTNFDEINPYLPNQFDILIPKIENYFSEIKSLGIQKLLIPNITLHETIDKISSDVEIIHAVDFTIKKLKKYEIDEIVIFGTIFTMNSLYLKKKFGEVGIAFNLPSKEHQISIDDFRKKVYEKRETPEEVSQFQNLCYLYSQHSHVILACTELSIHAEKSPHILDMAQIQIEEFLK